MVARTEARQPEQLAIVDPIWGSLLHEARSAAAQDPLLSAFLYSTILNHRSLEECVIYRICELLDHPDMQAVLLRQTFQDMLDDWPEWEACCASISRPFTTVIPPARASWSRSSISRGSRPSRPIALPIGCCKGPQGSGALSAKPLIEHLPDRYQSGRAHRQGHLPRPCHRAGGRRDGRHR